MRSEEEIINALAVLKEVCEKNMNCRICPLRNNLTGQCGMIHSFPRDYLIVKDVNLPRPLLLQEET